MHGAWDALRIRASLSMQSISSSWWHRVRVCPSVSAPTYLADPMVYCLPGIGMGDDEDLVLGFHLGHAQFITYPTLSAHSLADVWQMTLPTPWLFAGDPSLELVRLPARDSPWSTEDPDYCSEVEEEAHGPGKRASVDVSSTSVSSAPSRHSTPDVRTLQPRCTFSRVQHALAQLMPVRQSIVVDLIDMNHGEAEADTLPGPSSTPAISEAADQGAEVSQSSPPVGEDSELHTDASASSLEQGDEEYNAEDDAAEESEVQLD